MSNDLLYKRGFEKLTSKKEALKKIIENDLKKVSETIVSTKEIKDVSEKELNEERTSLIKINHDMSAKLNKIKDLTLQIKTLTNGLLELEAKTGEKIDLGEDVHGAVLAKEIFTKKVEEIHERTYEIYKELKRQEEKKKEKVKVKYLEKLKTKEGERKLKETIENIQKSDESRNKLGKEIACVLEKANEEEKIELELLLIDAFSSVPKDTLLTHTHQLAMFEGVLEFFSLSDEIFKLFYSAAKKIVIN